MQVGEEREIEAQGTGRQRAALLVAWTTGWPGEDAIAATAADSEEVVRSAAGYVWLPASRCWVKLETGTNQVTNNITCLIGGRQSIPSDCVLPHRRAKI